MDSGDNQNDSNPKRIRKSCYTNEPVHRSTAYRHKINHERQRNANLIEQVSSSHGNGRQRLEFEEVLVEPHFHYTYGSGDNYGDEHQDNDVNEETENEDIAMNVDVPNLPEEGNHIRCEDEHVQEEGEVEQEVEQEEQEQEEQEEEEDDDDDDDDDDEEEGESDEENEEYFDANDYPREERFKNTTMFEASQFSVWDVLTMIFAISLRFNLCFEATYAIFSMVKLLAGPLFQNWTFSKYSLKKFYTPHEKHILYIFYCPGCKIDICRPLRHSEIDTKKVIVCDECNKDYNLSVRDNNYFIVLDLEYQLRLLLQNKEIRNDVIQNKLRPRPEGIISDVQDTDRYKECESSLKTSEENTFVVSLGANVDGAEMKKSSAPSLYPLQVVFNELSLKIRFKNLLLPSIWYPSNTPNPLDMNLYMYFFVETMEKLRKTGVTVVNENGEAVTFRFFLFQFVADSVARPVVQNRFQYNGLYGCSWCYQRSEAIQNPRKENSQAQKYPLKLDVPIRTHEEYLQDVEEGRRLNKSVKGIKGDMFLTELEYFDAVWGFSFDYMHTVILGVVKQLWIEWSENGHLTKAQVREVNERLSNLKPTKEVHRLPTSLDKKKGLKAAEWEFWLVVHSIPCLHGILDDEKFKSYTLFVKSIVSLMSDQIDELVLLECEADLLQFVSDCENFYGKYFMTFNIHALLHLVTSVRKNGPIFTCSAYAYENYMSIIKKYICGTTAVMQQIADKTLQMSELQYKLSTMGNNNPALYFCQHLFERARLTFDFRVSVEGAVLVGNKTIVTDGVKNKFFLRCIFNGTVYHSMHYKRPRKTDNTYAQLSDDSVVRIAAFKIVNDRCFISYKKMYTESVELDLNVKHMFRVVGKSDELSHMKPVTMLKRKLHHLEIFGDSPAEYVCIPPNVVKPI